MTRLQCESKNHIQLITLNRIEKHNAFDEVLLADLQRALDNAIHNPSIRVILLNAHGRHFSAGADAGWMQRMAELNETENKADAMVLARVMHTLYHSPKPTIAVVQGCAYGGGAGLVAACDIAIAAHTAKFCFSEVKLGLIPAVISPYVIKAIGERAAIWLFMSAEVIDTARALTLQLIQLAVSEEELQSYAINYAEQLAKLAPDAVRASKSLVRDIAQRSIDEELQQVTAQLIAQKRVSNEGQTGLKAFLNKETPTWN